MTTIATEDETICELCAQIPWLKIVNEGFIYRLKLTTEEEESKALRCRICILLNESRQQTRSPSRSLGGTPVDEQTGLIGLLTWDWHETYPLAVSRSSPHQIQKLRQLTHPPKANVEEVLSWIDTCDHTHGSHCAPKLEVHLKGLKVIDCPTRTVVYAPQNCKYLALSYVWGSLPTPESTIPLAETPGAHQVHLPRILPKTIEDSIILVKMLGYRYLWIDRYVCLRCWLLDSGEPANVVISASIKMLRLRNMRRFNKWEMCMHRRS